jgi:predicted HAD superfamily Cof-like phosphohydrolase
MSKFFENVVDFNQKVLKIEPRPIGFLTEAENQITDKSLKEELKEFSDARVEGDLIGSVDALIDLMYFATGALYKMGLTADSIKQCGQAVHEANMEKKLGVNHRRGDGSAADAVKPADWVTPEARIGAILEAQ